MSTCTPWFSRLPMLALLTISGLIALHQRPTATTHPLTTAHTSLDGIRPHFPPGDDCWFTLPCGCEQN